MNLDEMLKNDSQGVSATAGTNSEEEDPIIIGKQ